MNKSVFTFIYVVAILVAIVSVSAIVIMGNAEKAQGEFGSFLKNSSRFEKAESQKRSISHFEDSFQTPAILEETGSLSDSPSSDWWVNSGGEFVSGFGVGHTLEGDLVPANPWFDEYRRNNPRDTDNGLHPQNVFRLVQTDTWNNFSQEVYFQIDAINMSDSEYRTSSNGVFLFNRYVTGDNLYYVGVRVDGMAVIKKKIDGIYYTMASTSVFGGAASYDRTTNPSLIPLHQWIGIKSQVVTNSDSSVSVRMYIDMGKGWSQILEVSDEGMSYGGSPLTAPGYAGIRTDFMDVKFKSYQISVI